MLNILASWPYLNHSLVDTLQEHANDIRLLVDSGAFTNWKSGKDTNVHDYIRFIKELPIRPWRYFNLDRIGDPATSKRNFNIMLDAGLSPVPIFTRGSDIKDLDEMMELSDVVGLGVGTKSAGYLGYTRWISEQTDPTRLHWLGVTNSNLIANFKPYSVDASSWESGGRFGQIPIYMGGGKFTKYSRTQARNPPSSRMWKVMTTMGFNPYDLQNETTWWGTYSFPRRMGAYSWVNFARDVDQQFQTKVFLATTNRLSFRCIWEAYENQIISISR
jgi:hypothetical protein